MCLGASDVYQILRFTAPEKQFLHGAAHQRTPKAHLGGGNSPSGRGRPDAHLDDSRLFDIHQLKAWILASKMNGSPTLSCCEQAATNPFPMLQHKNDHRLSHGPEAF